MTSHHGYILLQNCGDCNGYFGKKNSHTEKIDWMREVEKLKSLEAKKPGEESNFIRSTAGVLSNSALQDPLLSMVEKIGKNRTIGQIGQMGPIKAEAKKRRSEEEKRELSRTGWTGWTSRTVGQGRTGNAGGR